MFSGLVLGAAKALGFTGLSRRAAGIIGAVLLALLVVGAFFALLDAYGDARFREGEAHADAQWQAASDRLEEQAERAADDADEASAERQQDHAERLEEEKERLDEAHRHGTSPFDVLFGG